MSETKSNIRQHILEFINDGGPAQFHVQDSIPGVLFTDEGEFIPFADLGLNRELGFYRLSQFPDAENVADGSNPETIHRGDYEWEGYVWADEAGDLHLIGEKWQVADLYQAIGAFLLRGELDPEAISDDDPAWGTWSTIAWAVDEAMAYDCERYSDREQVAATIRAAARRGSIPGVRQSSTGRWMFQPRKFRGWLVREENHRPGPNPSVG